jgi:ubiquinone/menaquinone biosynthesis C-methylase UbiE
MDALGKYDNADFVDLFIARQYGANLKVVGTESLRLLPDLGTCEAYYTKLISLARSVFSEGGVCVDIGCGPGRIVGEFARFGNGLVIGLDESTRMLQMASRILCESANSELTFDFPLTRTSQAKCRLQSWGLSNVLLVRGNAEHLPFRQGKVGLACCANVLSRIADPHKCLQELHRVLKPRGFLILSNDYDWTARYTEPSHWFDDVRTEIDPRFWSINVILEDVPYTAWLHGRKGIVALNQILLLQKT